MKNMKISAKLLTGFLTVTFLVIIIGVTGILGLTQMDKAANSMYLDKARPLGDLTDAVEYTQRIRVQARNCILYTGKAEILKTVENDVNDRFVKFEAAMAAYEPTLVDPRAQELFKECMTSYNNVFKPTVLEVLEDAKKGVPQDVLLANMEKATEATNALCDGLNELTNIRMSVMESASADNTKLGNTLLIIIIAVVIISVIASISLALYISNLISVPVIAISKALAHVGKTGNLELPPEVQAVSEKTANQKDEFGDSSVAFGQLISRLHYISDNLEAIANGDLTADITLASDHDVMGNSLRKMSDSLNKMFSEINNSANQVSTGASQIADGAQLLAQGATEQSATVEELSASILEVAAKTSANAGMAGDARDLGESIKQNAEKGTGQMEQMMQAVQEINESSKSIGKVIKIIDDIAFQTNILALNAAVEAARAGQHGKGFAVVADEVRSLAAKSAEAAKNTNELIESSISKAELGAMISGETSESLKQIVEGVLQSSQLIAEIAQSSDEQSVSVNQISEAIGQVAQVVQQNSATAEQSAAASEEMSGQAGVMQQLVAQFKVKGTSRGDSHSAYQSAPKIASMATSTGFSMDDGKY